MRKHAYEQLRPYLARGETLLWSGRPARGFRLTPATVIISVALFVFTCAWLNVLSGAIAGDGSKWPGAVLLTFVCGVLWFMLLAESLIFRHVAYGVTDRRVIIADSLIGGPEKSIPYWNLRSPFVSGSRNFGTIRCSRDSMGWKNQSKPGRASHPALFRRISDADAVCDLILEQCARVAGDDPTAVMAFSGPALNRHRADQETSPA